MISISCVCTSVDTCQFSKHQLPATQLITKAITVAACVVVVAVLVFGGVGSGNGGSGRGQKAPLAGCVVLVLMGLLYFL